MPNLFTQTNQTLRGMEEMLNATQNLEKAEALKDIAEATPYTPSEEAELSPVEKRAVKKHMDSFNKLKEHKIAQRRKTHKLNQLISRRKK